MSCFHVEENIFWIDLHFCYTCFTTEETYQERQCRLVKSCVTTFHPSLREEQVSTATFTSSLNRTHTSTSRRISDHCNGEQTYLIIIYSSPTLVHWKEVCTDVWSQNCFLWIVQKTLSRCLSFSHSLKARTFNTLEFYRKHQDSITPAGLAFFQSQWDESVTKTFHSTLSESINYILSWTSRISMNNVIFCVDSWSLQAWRSRSSSSSGLQFTTLHRSNTLTDGHCATWTDTEMERSTHMEYTDDT